MRIAVCAVWVPTSITHSLPPPSPISHSGARSLGTEVRFVRADSRSRPVCVARPRTTLFVACRRRRHPLLLYMLRLLRSCVRAVFGAVGTPPHVTVPWDGCWTGRLLALVWVPSVRPSVDFSPANGTKEILCAALVVIVVVVVVVVNGPGSGTGYCGVCRSICSSASRSAVFVHVCSIRCAFLRLAPVCRVHLVKYLGTFLLLGDILCLGVLYIRPCGKKIQGFKEFDVQNGQFSGICWIVKENRCE